MRVISLRSSLGTHTVCEVVSREASSPTVLGNDGTGIDTSTSSVSGSSRDTATSVVPDLNLGLHDALTSISTNGVRCDDLSALFGPERAPS